MASNLARTGDPSFKPIDLADLLNTDNEINHAMETLNSLMIKRKDITSRMRSKHDMLSQMSHDLRTPLNSIIGFSELLIEGINGTLNAGQAEFIRNIHESAIELLESVKAAIDLHDSR